MGCDVRDTKCVCFLQQRRLLCSSTEGTTAQWLALPFILQSENKKTCVRSGAAGGLRRLRPSVGTSHVNRILCIVEISWISLCFCRTRCVHTHGDSSRPKEPLWPLSCFRESMEPGADDAPIKALRCVNWRLLLQMMTPSSIEKTTLN